MRFLLSGVLMAVLPPTEESTRQQCRRNLSKVDATLQNPGRKARQVADHAAAERYNQPAAIHAILQQLRREAFQAGKLLLCSPGSRTC